MDVSDVIDLAAARARRTAAAESKEPIPPGTAVLSLNEDGDLELNDPRLGGILVLEPELAITFGEAIVNLGKLARAAKNGPKP